MIDEPLVTPVSPGSALVRLAQVAGALQRSPQAATLLPAEAIASLQKARQTLEEAVEAGDYTAVRPALRDAQQVLRGLYQSLGGEAAAPIFGLPIGTAVQPVNIATICATFTRPERQVLTTLAFDDALGATAYWLHELRELRGQILEDSILETLSPVFPRLRLPIGPHRFRIESRNPSESVTSAEFSVEVPPL